MAEPASTNPAPNKAASGTKACSICGIDVTNASRTKDASGNYVCTECMKNAKSTAWALKNPPKPVTAQPVAAREDDNGFLLHLGTASQALQGGKECPKCARILNQSDHLCLGCGYNFDAGKVVHTKVERAPKVQGESGSSRGLSQTHIAVIIIAAIIIGAVVFLILPRFR